MRASTARPTQRRSGRIAATAHRPPEAIIASGPTRDDEKPGSASAVFTTFLRLGLTSFGGPIAHLGYFRREFVERRRWVDDVHFAQLLAICQFLPGPASSQLGFAIGLQRAGLPGALAAFVAFTLPSAALLLAFALLAPEASIQPLLRGLKLVAVCVVAHGLLGMARALTPDLPRALIALGAATLLLLSGNAWMQLLAIAAGALAGALLCRHVAVPAQAIEVRSAGRRIALLSLGAFLALLLAALAIDPRTPTLPALAAAFYQAGALVFGGGHVVLPLLQHALVDSGWMSAETFLTGYGAAQAVPGPMFSVAALYGAEAAAGGSALTASALALLAIFLPGFLLLLAVLPMWSRVVANPSATRAVAGVNAAVVGLLAAAFWDPVLSSGIGSWLDAGIAAAGFAFLWLTGRSALWVVLWCVAAAWLATWL